MRMERRTIAVGPGATVSSEWAAGNAYRPRNSDAVVVAHGAGSDMYHPFMEQVFRGLADKGLLTIRFNFPYTERGNKAPDPQARLEQTYRAVWESIGKDTLYRPRRVLLGGKSMGGRIASHIAAQDVRPAGLIFLGYPLHPPNRPAKLRDAHLGRITCPMLFIQGTRDALCRLDLLEGIRARLSLPTRLHIIEDGDHSFRVPKRTGRSQQSILDEIVDAIGDWIAALP